MLKECYNPLSIGVNISTPLSLFFLLLPLLLRYNPLSIGVNISTFLLEDELLEIKEKLLQSPINRGKHFYSKRAEAKKAEAEALQSPINRGKHFYEIPIPVEVVREKEVGYNPLSIGVNISTSQG